LFFKLCPAIWGAKTIPSAVFIWFFFLSVPIGILQDRIGKRKVLILGIIVTAIGLIIPFAFYTFAVIIVAFGLLGIGNTIVQVSANPLLIDVAPGDKKSSFLSFSQFIKAIGSMIAAPLAGCLAISFGNWRIIFIVFGIVSIISAFWLILTPIEETGNTESKATFVSSFKMLGNSYILMMVIGIFLVVGIDVGINSFSGQFLLNKFNCSLEFAVKSRSFYFFGKMIGTFIGSILLIKLSSRKIFFWSSVAGIISLLFLLITPINIARSLILITGLCFSNIWPLIFSLSVEKYPVRSSEISGLMILAISGGALIPLLMGWISDIMGVTPAIGILVLCSVYLLSLSAISVAKKEKS
jgi:MFS transporter, FHS family, L-fucose permease